MEKLFMVIDASSALDFNTLTKHRVPGAIPIFSKYRLIDFSLSSATSSNISNVGVFCNKNYRSLQDHIGSGSRYDLERRKDGVFILPPKNSGPSEELYLSFSRMKEHDEYFKRSLQEYVLITPANVIWTPDYNEILKAHIDSGKDITEVVTIDNRRLYTFIMKKKELVKYIESYNEIIYRNIVEVYDYSQIETKNTYIYKDTASYIKNVNDYYSFSLKILDDKDNVLRNMLKNIRPKDPLDAPSYFGKNSYVINSLIATGCYIDGEVENSIISRRVRIKKNTKISNSIILNNSDIEEDVVIENAILDKETTVKKGSIIKGTPLEPFISEKKQIVVSSVLPKVAILTAEITPYAKRGGLADMVGSLSSELSLLGADVTVFAPLYKEIYKNFKESLEKITELKLIIDSKEYHINIYKIEKEKLTYIFIDLYMYFDRDEIYGYIDDPERFGYFTYAVMEYLNTFNINIDCFHFHDWHMSLLPLFLKKYPKYKNSQTFLTIHNLNYQGEAPTSLLNKFRLDYSEFGSTFKFLEVGIKTATEITTVSKTYAEELKYDFYSGSLREALVSRSTNLYGIVNGLSSKYNPETDPSIKAQYNSKNVLSKKKINKKFLADLCGFNYSDDMFVIGSVSRINDIKGFDLIIDSLNTILETNDNIFFALLGVGDKNLMDKLKDIEMRFPSQVKLFLDFNGTNPSYIYSGADVFLMPSRIEPCGTSQMISMKYGTIPIVRQTGGLNDTVVQFDKTTLSGNGFKFYNIDSRDLIYTTLLAYSIFTFEKDNWNTLIKNAMNEDFSFNKCAKEYLSIYNLERKGE